MDQVVIPQLPDDADPGETIVANKRVSDQAVIPQLPDDLDPGQTMVTQWNTEPKDGDLAIENLRQALKDLV